MSDCSRGHEVIHEEWTLPLVPLRLVRQFCGGCRTPTLDWTLLWKRRRR